MISENELRSMYCDEGMSLSEIGRELGVIQNTVLYWMKKYAIDRRTNSESLLKNSITMSSEEDLRRMYCDEGMSTYAIGREIGVCNSTIFNWMKKYGIDMRDISKALLNGNFSGERSGGWQGGISGGKYCYKFNNLFKESVRSRDDYICQLCECTQIQNGRKLDVHHVHYDKENCAPDVVALCRSCNTKANANRDEWEKCFENDLSRRGLLNWRP